QPALIEFMYELAAVLHPAGLELSINLPANNDSFNYQKLSSLVDYVILMVYDQHYATSAPGPVSGVDWFTNVLRLRQADVPAEKTIVAIGNYAYDWDAGGEPATKTFEEAVLTASESSEPDSQVQIHLDPVSLNPTFQYADNEG